jgi:hypothetical protein
LSIKTTEPFNQLFYSSRSLKQKIPFAPLRLDVKALLLPVFVLPPH